MPTPETLRRIAELLEAGEWLGRRGSPRAAYTDGFEHGLKFALGMIQAEDVENLPKILRDIEREKE